MSAKRIMMLFLFIVLLTTPAYAVRIKIATLSPEGSFWMEKMREGAKEAAEKTEKRVNIKYYPGGVMGDDKAVLSKIRLGQLQGGALVSGSLSDVFPDSQVYGLPMKFKSFEEAEYARKKIDPLIIEGFEKNGFIILGMAQGGFAYMMSNDPIHSLSDLSRRKIWVPDNDPSVLEYVKAFDINPIPLSISDVKAGLQTGLIDTVTTSPIGAVTLQWHTQVKYLMDVPFLYLYAVLAIDKKSFSKISSQDQPVLREIMGRIFQEIDEKNRDDNAKALEALKKQGIQFIQPSSETMNDLYKRAEKIPENLVKSGRFSREIIDILDSRILEFRGK